MKRLKHTDGFVQNFDGVKAPHKAQKHAPSKTPMGMMELTEENCRFPIGDPKKEGFHFCGCKKARGWKPYCEAHMRAAYPKLAAANESGKMARSVV